MDPRDFVHPYKPTTGGFAKRFMDQRQQKIAIARQVAQKFATHGDLTIFVADGSTAALTFRALLLAREHRTQFVTNNLDVFIQYACVPETLNRMHEPLLIKGGLDQDANAVFPRFDHASDVRALDHALALCDVAILGASSFTWQYGPRSRHNRRQLIRRRVLDRCQTKTVILVLHTACFNAQDLQYQDEPAWTKWKADAALCQRHLHVVTCVPEDVEDLFSVENPPSFVPARETGSEARAYMKQVLQIRQALGANLTEIKKGEWLACDSL